MITRPTTDRGRATVARVLDAACALFAEKGVRATTLDEIGAAAGVGRGQLYHFFAGKADLVADVVGLQVERIVGPIRSAVDAMSTADDVRNFCEAIINLHDSSEKIRCPLGSLVPQLDDDNAAREALKAGFTQWEALLAEGLRRVADSGGLISGADPAVLAGGLLAAYQGGMLLADVTGDVESLRRALNTVVTAVLTPAVSA
jgi:TetR/AcrR family transcriptional regulator, transcriptional repressor for nem operon